MRRIGLILAVFTLFLSCLIQPAYPFWIWTPKKSRWVNPKASVKPSPQEQLKFAQALYEQSKYNEAIDECRKLIKYYPKAFEASEAQFYMALSFEGEKKLYEAFQAYQKVIDKYPFSKRLDEIIEKELRIAQAFMAGEKRKIGKVELPVENPAIEILRKVVDNSAYGKSASYAQYLLGMTLKEAFRYQEAMEEFEKVGTTYPESEWASQAKFQAADCASKIAPKSDYDQELTKEAKKKFEEFVKSQPLPELKEEAVSKIDTLKEKEAEGALKIAEFYEKQKKFDAARIYYQEVLDKCPYCLSATPARDKLKELEKK